MPRRSAIRTTCKIARLASPVPPVSLVAPLSLVPREIYEHCSI